MEQPENQETKFLELQEKFRAISLEKAKAKDFGLMTAVGDFGKKLREKYGSTEVGRYRLYHLIAGSGASDAEQVADLYDFPDPEDSVEKFIRTL